MRDRRTMSGPEPVETADADIDEPDIDVLLHDIKTTLTEASQGLSAATPASTKRNRRKRRAQRRRGKR